MNMMPPGPPGPPAPSGPSSFYPSPGFYGSNTPQQSTSSAHSTPVVTGPPISGQVSQSAYVGNPPSYSPPGTNYQAPGPAAPRPAVQFFSLAGGTPIPSSSASTVAPPPSTAGPQSFAMPPSQGPPVGGGPGMMSGPPMGGPGFSPPPMGPPPMGPPGSDISNYASNAPGKLSYCLSLVKADDVLL
jgi:hypothetical protein